MVVVGGCVGKPNWTKIKWKNPLLDPAHFNLNLQRNFFRYKNKIFIFLFFNFLAWKQLFEFIKSLGLNSWCPDCFLDTHITICYEYHICHMSVMTYDNYIIWQYECLENRQDLSNAGPGFKVSQKVGFLPKKWWKKWKFLCTIFENFSLYSVFIGGCQKVIFMH